MKIVLASSSPRRKELLQTAGINFEIDVEGVDEVPQGNTPEEKVCSIAAQKCRPVAARRPNDCVIGADTVVSVDGDILGKPHDREDAKICSAASPAGSTRYIPECASRRTEKKPCSAKRRKLNF